MDKYKARAMTAFLVAVLMSMCICLGGCDLFGETDDGGDIEVSETLDVPEDAEEDEEDFEEIEDPDDPTTKDYSNGISYQEEMPGANIKLVDADPSEFVGSWEAKSGDAHYLFGNLNLTIKDNGRWTANITDEDMRGTWEKKNGGIYLKGRDLEAQLNFTKDKKLLFLYHPDEESSDFVTVVLTKN